MVFPWVVASTSLVWFAWCLSRVPGFCYHSQWTVHHQHLPHSLLCRMYTNLCITKSIISLLNCVCTRWQIINLSNIHSTCGSGQENSTCPIAWWLVFDAWQVEIFTFVMHFFCFHHTLFAPKTVCLTSF